MRGWLRAAALSALLAAMPGLAQTPAPDRGSAAEAAPAGAPGSAPAPAPPSQGASERGASAQGAPQQAIPQNALPGGAAGPMGRVVERIQVVARPDEDESAWLTKIPLHVGDRLERDKLRESVQVLYRSGRFAEVIAEAETLASGGVALELRTTPSYFNGNVTVTGLPKGGPSETEVISTGRLDLGAEFTRSKLQESQDRILRLMQDSGYWSAAVEVRLTRHEQTQQVDVEYHVTAGPVARVGTFTVSGDPGLSPAAAEAVCRMHPGTRVRDNLLTKAIARLRKRYVKQGRLRAQLSAGAPVFHRENNSVDYSIAVEPGPVVEISLEGFKLSRSKLKRYVPVWEEHAVDEDLLNEGRRNLRDYLQSQGYFDAQVQVREEEDDAHTHQHILYVIVPGEKRTLRAIRFEGNKRFDSDTLRERMSVEPAGMMLSHGRFSQSQLASDLEAITALYKANGYLSVKATSQLVERYEGEAGALLLVVKIDEGSLVRVAKLEIRGDHSITETELRPLINTQAGQPFSEATVADDREAVLNEYFNHGFMTVQMETRADYADASHTAMNVVYDIQEGPQDFVRKVVVSGVEHTRPEVVERSMAIHQGEPLSQEKMLLSQRNLYDLGVFNEVRTAVQNPEGDELHKNVLFQVREARRWTIDYGGGLEIGTGLDLSQGGSPQGQTGVSPRVIFNVTRINFRGRAQSLIFKSHFGSLQKRAALSFDQPHWFDLPNWRFTATALYDNTRDVNTFSSSRVEGSVQLTQRATKASQLLYRYSYRRIEVDPSSFPAGFSTDLKVLYSKPVRVGMPSLTYLRDRRDDPVNSTKGNYITFDIGVASTYFGSEADFGRVMAQYAAYHKISRGWVLAHSTRIGVETPYGSLGYVPLPEGFFVGGSNSHRGFSINQAGPRDLASGSPLGGNAMFVNNFELRSPPAHLPWVGDNMSFVFFHDMGNAFATSNAMWHNLWRFSQKDTSTNPADLNSCANSSAVSCDFSYMSQAVGAGVRYHTPIGPVRVDFGYNLNPPVFPVEDPCAGAAGCTTLPYVDQVRHFNFFFSIGQTF